MRTASPVHVRPIRRVFHVKLKWRAHIAGDINGLHFTGAEVSDTALVIVRDKHNVNVACRLAVLIS